MLRVIAPFSPLSLALFVAACGGGDKDADDAVGPGPERPERERRPRERSRRPSDADDGRVPGRQGQDAAGAGRQDGRRARQLALASSVFTTPGDSRMAFGMIARTARRSTGRPRSTSRRRPSDPAEGPFVAPADVLLTDARYRSKQAATTERPVRRRLRRRRQVRQEGQVRGAGDDQAARRLADRRDRPGRRLHRRARTRSRGVGDKAPKVHTDTLESAKGDVSKIDTRDPAERHARRRLRRRGRQEAGRAAVRDAAAVPVAGVRAGDRHGAADEVQVRRQDGLHPSGGLRRQRHQQGPAAAAAGSSTCRTEPWLFVVDKPRARSPPASRARSACSSSRTRSSPGCENARSRRSRRPLAAAAPRAGGRRGARARPAPAAADPAVAVRVGGRGGARDLVLRAGRAVAAAAAGAGQLAAARRAGGRSRALPVQIICGAIGVVPARRHDPRRLHRRAARRWTTGRRRSC